MGSNRGFNAILEFDEILTPVDRGSGTISVAQRQANAQANLGLSGSGASGADLAANSITGTDSNLDINGQAAAQGGTVIVTGGTSSTSANAGGAARLHGGLPGATGIGGDATVRGAIGGATSGAGGLASITGGAGTAGNSAGGLARAVGGAGQGSAAGGAVLLTGGAGGATGAGGAITITSGAGGATSGVAGAIAISVGAATTSGNGSSITVTAGSGAGGTNSGGNVNLVGGAAVSTGTPGEVQINGNGGITNASFNYTSAMVTQTFFVATRAVRVKAIIGRPRVAGSGGACTLSFYKAPSGTAVGSGTVLHSGSFNVVGTADTNQTLTLSTTVADVTLAAGDSIGYVLTGTPTSAVGSVTVMVNPI